MGLVEQRQHMKKLIPFGASLAALALFAGRAGAVTLPSASLYDSYVGGAISDSIVYLTTAPGTVSTAPVDGGLYWGPATATVALGSHPSASFSALNNVAPLNDYGAGANIDLTYYLEYANPGAKSGSTVSAKVTTSDTLGVTGNFGWAKAALTISAVDVVTPYAQQECLSTVTANACAYQGTILTDGLQHSGAPLSDQTIQLVENQLYSVVMQVYGGGMLYGNPGGANGAINATTIAAVSDGGGQLLFSPGIASGAPEPGAWALVMVGVGGVGVVLRSRRRPLVSG